MNIKNFLCLFIGYGNVDTAPKIINHNTKEIQNINETEINQIDYKIAFKILIGSAKEDEMKKCYDLSDKSWYPLFSFFFELLFFMAFFQSFKKNFEKFLTKYVLIFPITIFFVCLFFYFFFRPDIKGQI